MLTLKTTISFCVAVAALGLRAGAQNLPSAETIIRDYIEAVGSEMSAR